VRQHAQQHFSAACKAEPFFITFGTTKVMPLTTSEAKAMQSSSGGGTLVFMPPPHKVS